MQAFLSRRVWLLGAALVVGTAAPGWALEPRLVPEFTREIMPSEPSGMELAAWFAPEDAAGGGASKSSGMSPALVGLMSAVIPGSGQLAMGQDRGWLYLGVEVAGWFGWWALHASGNQAADDAHAYADDYWALDRYASDPAGCGVAGAGTNFEQNLAVIEEQQAAGGNDYYNSLEDVTYACGWETQNTRGTYLGMMDDADGLYKAARGFTAAIFLNHFVSAIDAARSASKRRSAEQAMNLRFYPEAKGALAMRVTMRRAF